MMLEDFDSGYSEKNRIRPFTLIWIRIQSCSWYGPGFTNYPDACLNIVRIVRSDTVFYLGSKSVFFSRVDARSSQSKPGSANVVPRYLSRGLEEVAVAGLVYQGYFRDKPPQQYKYVTFDKF